MIFEPPPPEYGVSFMTTARTPEDIAELMRVSLDANKTPMEVDASVFAQEILFTRNATFRAKITGNTMVAGAVGRNAAIKAVVPDVRFTDVWVGVTRDAVVTKWNISGTLPDGSRLLVPFCSIFHVRDGRIVSQDLYSDSAADATLSPLVFSQPGQNMDVSLDKGVTILSDGPAQRPIVAQKSPFAVEVEAGKNYWWCSCGRSKRQPFCDGSHIGTGLQPHSFTAEKTRTVLFCGCKATRNAPLCDASHMNL
jgi:CDGSH-type Zn-finger protein